MKSIIQTAWVKPVDQTAFVCQITSVQDYATSITLTFRDLLREHKEIIIEKKKSEAKKTLLDLIEHHLDETLKDFEAPNLPIEKAVEKVNE